MLNQNQLLSISINENALPVPPDAVRAGQFFRIKNFKGEWSTAIHLAVDVRLEPGGPLVRRCYNFVTGECYGPVPPHWQCYILDAEIANGVGGSVPLKSFAAKA